MRVRLLLDCSLGHRGVVVDVGEPDCARLLRKGRAVVVEPVAPLAPPVAVAAEPPPEEVPEPEALAAEPPAGPEA